MYQPTLKYLVLACLLYANLGTSQSFPPFNLALDDSCTHAPFFCESALSALSTNNFNGTANGMDTLTGCIMENTVWLCFTTCEDSVQLDFMVDSCSIGSGLEFTLFDTDDCINYAIVGSPCQTILDQTTSSLTFNNLTAGQTYTLAIDGINGDFCSFAIDTTIGIYMPSIGSGPDSDFEWVTIEAAYIIPPPENCPSGDYEYVPPVCELQPTNCNGGGPPLTTCDIEYNICKLDPGTYIYPAYVYDTLKTWYYPDCAIVTGDTLSNIINIDISDCLADYISTLILPPPPPMDTFPPTMPIAFFDFSYGVNWQITRTLDSMNTDTVIISDGGITYCPGCATNSDFCGECNGDVNNDDQTPIYYCQEDFEVCPPPDCTLGECPGDFNYQIDGCKINAQNYTSTDPQDEYLGQFDICPGDCLDFNGFTFCGEGSYSYPDIDLDGCEIEVFLDLVIFQYPPIIISSSGGTILDCNTTCTTLNVSAIDAEFYDWGGAGGNSSSITVCAPGSYTCNVSNACGDDQISIVVLEDINPPDISLTASVPVLTIDMNSSVLTANHTGNGASFVFNWTNENNFSIGITQSITVTEPGTYTVQVTNTNNGCYTEANIEIFEDIVFLSQTPLGSSCNSAPLFCADFLVNLDTDNENGQPDSTINFLNCSVENGVWLKFVACDSTASLAFQVDSCNQAQGLEFSIIGTSNCIDFDSLATNCQTVASGSTDTLTFENLSADSIYYLLIDGIDGDVCNVNINAINGIMNSGYGDTLNPLDTINYRLEQIVEGSISGPTTICAFEESTFIFNPGICGLVEGDCNRSAEESEARIFADPCDLPFALCFGESIQTDTIVDWDIPDGIDIIGDSTDFEITIEPSLDWILDQYNGMIPASDTDTIVITLYADYSIVPINDTINSDSTEVFCFCPASGIICGSCDTGASLEVEVIVIFDNASISECDPDCQTICDGQVLCPGESVYCTDPCVLTTWTLIEEPPQTDNYLEEVCPGECAQTPYGEYCPGSYFIEIDPCLFVNIDIFEMNTNIVFPDEIICPGDCVNVGSMTFCNPGFETWTEEINGCTVQYSVTINQFNTIPIDYGIETLCEGECLTISGNTFCAPGIHNFLETSPDGCEIDATVELIWESAALSIGPVTELCNAAGDEFNVSFSIFGDAPFTVNGVEITGNFFTSDYYSDGDAYYFEVKNSLVTCPNTEIIAGSYSCPLTICDNDPGLLNVKNENHCASNTLIVEEVSPVIIGINDFTYEYVLHEGSDPFSNTILMRNQNGIFNYDNSLIYNVEYTVSRIIGERLAGGETVDIDSGDCLKFTTGPSVIFYSDPILILDPIGDLHIDCNKAEITLTANPSGGSNSFTTNWNYNDTIATGGSINANQEGMILIDLVDNLTGCSIQQTVEITADFDEPIFALEESEMLDCLIEEVEISATLTTANNQLQFEWIGPFGTLPLGSNPLSVQAVEPGWHYLNIINEANGCGSIDSVLILRNENLVEEYDLLINQPICADDPMGSLSVSNIQGGTAPYNFYLNGMTFLGEIDNLSPGVYELELIDQRGCEIIDEFEITAPTPLESNLVAEITVEFGEDIQLDPNLNFSPFNIAWIDSQSKVLGNDEFLNINIQEDQRISFTATDENGCIIEKSVLILVKELDQEIYAPSAFSPNGDLVNDSYELFAAEQVSKINKLTIFDRWGNLVFQAEDYLPGDDTGKWDGNFKGKKLNSAVFIFIAEYTLIDGKQVQKTGDLTLFR